MKQPIVRNSKSLALSLVSIGGVLLTAWLSARNTKKYLEVKEEKQPESKKEEAVILLQNYWQTLVAVGGTVVCIIGAQHLNTKQITAMAGTIAFLQQKYKKYREAVIEEVGPEKEREIQAKIAEKDWDIYGDGRLPQHPDTQCELFYDTYTEGYFWAPIDRVKDAMYHLNRNFQFRGDCLLDEFYNFIGIELDDEFKKDGWLSSAFWDSGLTPWIDFDSHWGESDYGTKCYIIHYVWEPEDMDKAMEREGMK